jgi:hypothetical protein
VAAVGVVTRVVGAAVVWPVGDVDCSVARSEAEVLVLVLDRAASSSVVAVEEDDATSCLEVGLAVVLGVEVGWADVLLAVVEAGNLEM